MNTPFRFMSLAGICLLIFVRAQNSSLAAPQQEGARDSIKTQIQATPPSGHANTFKLLPKFDNKRDTAGFRYIPKNYETNETIPLDREPRIIKKVEPVYPDSAKRAGLEGKVIVKMWVDKDGMVKKVSILRSTAEIFNQPALDAAKKFVFVPAYVNKKPVAVWISYPFEFRLGVKR